MKYYNKSALGEYVHLYAENYLKYGVSRKWHKAEQFYGGNYSNFLENRVQKIKAIDQNTLDVLAQRLTNDSPQQVHRDRTKLTLDYQTRIDEIFQMVTENAPQRIIGYLHGTQVKNKANPMTPSFDYALLKETALTEEEIESRFNQLGQLYAEIDFALKREVITYTEARKFIQRYENITGREDFSMRTDKSIKSSLGRLQQEIDKQTEKKTKTEIIGYFGEAWVASASDHVQKVALDQLRKNIATMIIGNKGSSFWIKPEQLPMNLEVTLNQIGYNKNIYKTHFSKNKVDVEMTVNNQDILANVKTYYNASQVTLQSKVNLLDSLVYLEQIDKFGTHWLNMHAGTLKGSFRDEADELLKREIGYEALVIGNPLKEDQKYANVFIHINRANGKVEVASTKDLIINSFNRLKINPRIESILLNNEYQPTGADSRIAKLLLDTHQTILSVSLSGSLY